MKVFICGGCSGSVSLSDSYCSGCGSMFDSKKEKLTERNPKFKEIIKDIMLPYWRLTQRSNPIPLTSPYRAVHKKPTVDDFFIATEVLFKHVTQPGMTGQEINKIWEDIKKKGKHTQSPQSYSEYVVSGTKIYRYSNHWGRVASCDWDITEDSGVWSIGVADIKDFKIARDSDKIAIKGYVALNPEYKKTVLPEIETALKKLKMLSVEYDLGVTAMKVIDLNKGGLEYNKQKVLDMSK